MLCLGIESTAHSFGVGIVDDKGKVLSNPKSVYIPPSGWGIEPMKAAEHHRKVKERVLQDALEDANIKIDGIDIIAFSQGPGLPPCLHQGLNLARELSQKTKAPLVGVNHCIAHIEIGKLFTKARDPITLYVSGANTQVLGFTSGKYRCFGETMDVGIGNALDKLGRELGLRFPAGPKIEQLALKGSYLELPYVVKGMDLSFSGIVTECLRKSKSGEKIENIFYSFQETAFAMLTEVTERALAHTGKSEVLLTGGVAANSRLQGMLETMCRERGARFYKCPQEYCGDCGANIGWAGMLQYRSKCNILKPKVAAIIPRQRTDDVEVSWIG